MKCYRYLKRFSIGNFAIFLIKCYQYIFSPYLGGRCKYYPSCSNYALEAFAKRNFLVAFFMVCYRILRCNPFSLGGYDPVDKNDSIDQ